MKKKIFTLSLLVIFTASYARAISYDNKRRTWGNKHFATLDENRR
ncbi:MAG: hypothetical protein WKG06_13625 [Segetibacter sp.]